MFGGAYQTATLRPRLLIGIVAGLLVGLLLPDTRLSARLLVAWDVATGLYLVLVAAMMARSDYDGIQRRADAEDPGAVLVLLLAVVASVTSLAAIGVELSGLDDAPAAEKPGRLLLVGATILLSWLFVHTTFALHYAHDFYHGVDDRRGLRFPGDENPDYWDFLYFSFNLGAAAQTSDVAVEAKRMRRLVLAQTILSFLFNTTILAFAINVGAGML